MNELLVQRIVENALMEDMPSGDITTEATVPHNLSGEAICVAKEAFLLAGTMCFRFSFEILDPGVEVDLLFEDGDQVPKGATIARVRGRLRTLLMGERVGLNFVQRLSGIATLTSAFVKEVTGTRAKIVDTRKTTPNLRVLEKYAVTVGGGYNHRFSLSDGVLIKDNHIVAAGGVREAIKNAKALCPHSAVIEIEVSRMEELKEALKSGAEAVLLDNMSVREIKEAVSFVRSMYPGVKIEASGGVSLENVREIAETGVDIISVGALTHSFKSVDISMRLMSS